MAEEASIHSREQAFEDILETNLEGCTLHVCLASIGAEDNAPRFERIQLEEDEELAKEFEGIVAGVLKRYKRENDAGSLRLCDYDEGAAVSDSHEVECVDLSDRNFIGEQISGLESLSDLGLFRADHTFVDGLKFYVIVLQRADGTTINFFRSYRPSKEVTRSTGFAAFFSSGQFNKVRQPTFLFDRNIDCVASGRHMFVLQRNNFETIFRFFEALEQRGRDTLDEVSSKVPIKNFDEFAAACMKHRGKLAKLGIIGSSGLLDELNMEALKATIADFDLSVQTITENGSEMFVYDSSDQWALLKLLEDGYMRSQNTGRRYEITGKRRHKR